MRGKRAKTYKKLMEKFSITFGFREPYQVLVDDELVKDCLRFSMEVGPALERTLRGKVKPMITQCCMRHLYAIKNEPGIDKAIEFAKTLERRRCGHHPEDFPQPKSTIDCIYSVVDGKGKGENKHRYVVASQDQDLRRMLRQIPGVPLIYVSRSVMIMEPMADVTEGFRDRDERAKFRAEIKKQNLGKRKREDDDNINIVDRLGGVELEVEEPPKKKKKSYGGTKGPNPLSVKKPKKKPLVQEERKRGDKRDPGPDDKVDTGRDNEMPSKKKRKRRPKKAEGVKRGDAEPSAVSSEA